MCERVVQCRCQHGHSRRLVAKPLEHRCEPERRASRPVSFGRRELESWACDAQGKKGSAQRDWAGRHGKFEITRET
eukprot:scaffold110564_cov45-Phaeocystis_antarctica.AAC.3